MSQSTSPRDLLYAMLALQLELLSLDDVRAALDQSADAPDRQVREVLVDNGKLSPQQDRLVLALVDAHLANTDGDAELSLATLEHTSAGQEVLSQLTDRNQDATATFDSSGSSEESHSPAASNPVKTTSAGERFRKIRPHAAGGLGEVSLARDEQLKRDVALKELQARHLADEVKRRRFILEGEVTGALEHPNIVPVYAMGIDAAGEPFYAMRFVKGESLSRAAQRAHKHLPAKKLLRRDCLNFRRLLTRLIAVCHALDYAHSRGVVHRDIKPANVMLGKHGETYVVDWGLARTAGSPTDELSLDEEFLGARNHSEGHSATEQGSIVGTPGYMPPEQALGQVDSLGPWSDVYALGATLYAMLVGKPPLKIEDGDVVSYVSRVEEGLFDTPRKLKPETPRELEAICLKAMSPPIADRYQSAGEMAEELERWLGDEPVLACPPTFAERVWRWCRRHRDWVMAGMLLLALAAVTSVLLARTFRAQAAREKRLADENLELAVAESAARELADRRYLDARESVDRWLIGYSESLRNYPGMQDVQRTMLERAADEYARFSAEQVDDPTLQLEQGLTLVRLGNVRRSLGDPKKRPQGVSRCLGNLPTVVGRTFKSRHRGRPRAGINGARGSRHGRIRRRGPAVRQGGQLAFGNP